MHRHRSTGLALALFALALVTPGCGGDESTDGTGGGASTLALDGETELFPGFEYATGLQPEGSPVQASFTMTATGVATVHAEAVASGSADAPTLTGLPGTGKLGLEGGFAMVGQLKIDITGLPGYDGPIPGIEDISIPVSQVADFDPFLLDGPATADAPIPATDLPGIPLPGGIPGQLVLAIAEGSVVQADFAGTCAGIDGGQAVFSGALSRGGNLVIAPRVEVEVPGFGTQSFDIPAFTVDLAGALGSSEVTMKTKVTGYGAKPEGDSVQGSCGPDTGSGGAGNGAASGSGNGGNGAGNGGAGGGNGATTSASGTPSSSAAGTSGCSEQGTYAACVDCLLEANPSGFAAYQSAIIGSCLCANECESQCTADCADPTIVTPECDACVTSLPGDSQCSQDATAACAASAACSDLVSDMQNVCGSLP